mmetsp:Transcript_17783/g.54179  ORF Transcript_17783/g.54179 Transcript_17783/m.54179 type:complete len:417 (-) Transcript_17783:57-1307(-)
MHPLRALLFALATSALRTDRAVPAPARAPRNVSAGDPFADVALALRGGAGLFDDDAGDALGGCRDGPRGTRVSRPRVVVGVRVRDVGESRVRLRRASHGGVSGRRPAGSSRTGSPRVGGRPARRRAGGRRGSRAVARGGAARGVPGAVRGEGRLRVRASGARRAALGRSERRRDGARRGSIGVFRTVGEMQRRAGSGGGGAAWVGRAIGAAGGRGRGRRRADGRRRGRGLRRLQFPRRRRGGRVLHDEPRRARTRPRRAGRPRPDERAARHAVAQGRARAGGLRRCARAPRHVADARHTSRRRRADFDFHAGRRRARSRTSSCASWRTARTATGAQYRGPRSPRASSRTFRACASVRNTTTRQKDSTTARGRTRSSASASTDPSRSSSATSTRRHWSGPTWSSRRRRARRRTGTAG